MNLYFDGDNIRKELLDEEARLEAENFIPLAADKKPARDALKNAQLRRFFGEFKGYQRKLEQRQGAVDENFKSILPMVKMMNAKVTYARARNVVPPSFESWMKKHVAAIESARDFQAFLLHFEAVIGFCYGRNPKD
jgi:CRISPR-associated protein Csm2